MLRARNKNKQTKCLVYIYKYIRFKHVNGKYIYTYTELDKQ